MVWGMLNGSRRDSRPGAWRPVRLSLECLERRDCPSPVITCFSATPTNTGGRQVELRGTVADNHPEQDLLTFTGAAVGHATPDIYGNFDYFTSACGLGTVTAVATHSIEKSLPVTAIITSAAPVITSFQVIQGPNGNWTFQGTVADECPTGIVLTFGGNAQVNGLRATVDQNGNFSATFYLPNLTSGFVTANCSDVWGLQSNTVTDPLI
jgi:hypothetical protein